MAGARAKYSSNGTTFNNIYGSVVGAPSLYTMPAYATTTAYVGRWTAAGSSSGDTCRLHLCFSAGYNGGITQMMDTYVTFCFGNGSGTLYNCWVDYRPLYNSSFLVKYVVSGASVDFYVETTTYFGEGYYVVTYQHERGNWEHKGTNVSDTPTGAKNPEVVGRPVIVSSTQPTAPDCMIWVQT